MLLDVATIVYVPHSLLLHQFQSFVVNDSDSTNPFVVCPRTNLSFRVQEIQRLMLYKPFGVAGGGAPNFQTQHRKQKFTEHDLNGKDMGVQVSLLCL